MKAMIFAAGLGTRIRNVSGDLPKCLMDIGGITILEHVISRLKMVGVSTVVINLHYQGDKIRDYLTTKNNFGLSIFFSVEENLLETGGGLLKAKDFFKDEPYFLIHNSDVYSEVELKGLIDVHRDSAGIATVAVRSNPGERALIFNEESRLIGWDRGQQSEKILLTESGVMNRMNLTGIHVVSPRLFNFMAQGGEERKFSIVESYIDSSRRGEKVFGYDVGNSYWIDVGTPERLEELRRHLVQQA